MEKARTVMEKTRIMMEKARTMMEKARTSQGFFRHIQETRFPASLEMTKWEGKKNRPFIRTDGSV